MLKRLFKNKKGQNTAEYAILIGIVVASIVAMQVYARRALNARVRDASTHLTSITGNFLGNTAQYEPYYQDTNYDTATDSTERELLGVNQVERQIENTQTRTGSDTEVYNATRFGEDF